MQYVHKFCSKIVLEGMVQGPVEVVHERVS
jgi:hypothetical protein